METENSSDNHICNHCNNSIPPLTYKLQQHSTSSLWMKHGQCCAACISPNDIEAVNKQAVLDNQEEKSYTEAAVKEGARRTNILLALSLAYDLEKKSGEKRLKRASRIIVAGRLIVATGIFASLLFLFYEMFTLSLISSFLGVVGIFICKLGRWKKHRIK